jgi:hypothetical protein
MGAEITNAEFLTELFGEYLDPDRDPRCYAWVDYFTDDPQTAPQKVWFGQKWNGNDYGTNGTGNAFFSIGLVKYAAKKGDVLSTISRRKECFACLPCVMLDDIGTKADEELPVPPTWMIETSPGNYQAGYLFTAPIEGISDADAYIKALTAAGRLTDAGGQNVTRYARLPVGSNTKAKYGDPFPHRLTVWEPSRRYDPIELADQLGLDLTVHKPLRNRGKRDALRGSKIEVSDDEVFQAQADENPVVTILKSRGLYKSPLGSGQHDITCPWVSEHTDQIDGGTAYWEPDATYTRGGFKCQHGHCHGRRIGALLDTLGITSVEAKNRPQIKVQGGALHTIVNHAERLLAETGHYFQQGGLIVQIVTDQWGETRVVPLSKPAVQMILTRLASWMRLDKRADAWFEVDAPPNHSTVLWDAAEYRNLPPLLTLARQPFMRPDGTVCATSGYDPETGLFGVFDPRSFPIIPNPSRQDAELALARLKDLLGEFEFRAESDLSAAISGILTGAVRTSLPTAPGILATAHTFGSGKSYLLDILAAFATPDDIASTTFVIDDDEMRKQLVATLMESPSVVKFDEMRGDLIPIKCLLSALTSERIEGRILGVSKMARPSTRSLMLFAGNNVQAVLDMGRRIVTIHLDPQSETPAARNYKADPLNQVLKPNRGKYLADALTIIRAWIKAGKPASNARPLNGFGQWSEWCREPLLWLGLPDPCEGMFTQMADDPDRETLGQLLHVWNTCFGRDPVMVRALIARANDVKDLNDVLLEIAGSKGDLIDRARLGKWLKSHAGKIVDGMRIVKDETDHRNAAKWKLTNLPTSRKSPDHPDSPDSRTSKPSSSESGKSGKSGVSRPSRKNVIDDDGIPPSPMSAKTFMDADRI